MPPARNSPPVPIDKSKYGMNSRMSPSHLMDIKKMGTIARVNATKVEGTNNHNPATDIYQTRRAGIMISALKTIPRALCYTCPSTVVSDVFSDTAVYYVTTIAGGGALSGDGGPAITTEINNPRDIAIDSYRNVYFAEQTTNRIRKVNASTGIITTIAGKGPGFSALDGEGGLAIDAGLSAVSMVAVDASNNIYCSSSYWIRKVTASTGIITTITSDEYLTPRSVFFNSSGIMYVVDWGWSNISTFNATTRNTVIAGTGASGYTGDGGPATSALVNHPNSACVDSYGNVYIADTDNNVIRKVTASTGIITTIAGTGSEAFNGDNLHALSTNLARPSDIDVDSSGNLYILDSVNCVIRRMNASTGIITIIAGTPRVSGFSGDGGPAIGCQFNVGGAISKMCLDSSRNIYITDSGNFRIRKLTLA